MHSSIEQYLEFLHTKRRTPTTLKVIRHDLTHFVVWWEGNRRRTFDPAFARHLLLENPVTEVRDVPTEPLAPRSLPAEAIDALLRVAHAEQNTILRARDEALLALLIYAGLRVQEACDLQLLNLIEHIPFIQE